MAPSASETLQALADLGFILVDIPAGTFFMGSPESDPDRYDDEGPQHEVSVSAFQMAQTPTTQAQWRWVAENLPMVDIELNPDPSRFKGEKRPVENVNWHQSVEFCKRLSAATGMEFSLPSEAQWEYACRAGTTTPFYCGNRLTPADANYSESGINQTTDVGSYPANPWGLFDMIGNVWQWCLDSWHENYEGAPTDGSAWL
jgi:formylglycine-generating enzyme required for sulfatase activity